jgi:hypothetical protein
MRYHAARGSHVRASQPPGSPEQIFAAAKEAGPGHEALPDLHPEHRERHQEQPGGTDGRVTPLVELYTSEGCNSCPPADRWLSTSKPGSPTVALAFHVDYRDRLGWPDGFATPAFTQRQADQQATNGARFSHTPHVVVDGRDRKDWRELPMPPAAPLSRPATVSIVIERRAEVFRATVTPGAAAPARLSAYWALAEHGHVSAVKAGENEGATLCHDPVVREYRPVPAWSAGATRAQTLENTPARPADAMHPRQINLVVIDAATGRPVQVLKLDC